MTTRLILSLLCCASLASSQNPFPLQQGNIWQYASSDPMDPHRLRMEVIGDTVLSNSKNYFVVSGSMFTSPFLRVDGSKVYAYSVADSMEFNLFDFLAMPGDTISTIYGGSMTITLEWMDTTGRDWWYFVLWQGLPPTWYEFIEWEIRDSLGLVWLRVEPGMTWYLTGARINGDTIGHLTTVTEEGVAIPAQPKLLQNFPNPFNPSTTIRYSVATETFVTLKVYNILAEKVTTLVNEEKEAGSYHIQFDGTGLASGVYFYRMKAGEFVETRKFLLLR